MKKNEWIYEMEHKLSYDKNYWLEAGLIPLTPLMCYTAWYCEEQSKKYQMLSIEIGKGVSKSIVQKNVNNVIQRNNDLRKLVPQNRQFILSRRLDGLISTLETLKFDLSISLNNLEELQPIITNIISEISELYEAFSEVSIEALNYFATCDYVEENDKTIVNQ